MMNKFAEVKTKDKPPGIAGSGLTFRAWDQERRQATCSPGGEALRQHYLGAPAIIPIADAPKTVKTWGRASMGVPEYKLEWEDDPEEDGEEVVYTADRPRRLKDEKRESWMG